MFVETPDQYESFYKDISGHDLILYVIPSNTDHHPTQTQPISLFFYDIQSGVDYALSFSHPDIAFRVCPDDVNHRFLKQENRLWALNKKELVQTIPLKNIYDINLLCLLKNNTIIDPPIHTPAHEFIKRIPNSSDFNGESVPILKHKEVFMDVVRRCIDIVKDTSVDEAYKNTNTIVIDALSEMERNGLAIDTKIFQNYFKTTTYSSQQNDFVYTQYNIYTVTGRPSNRFGGVNYAALNKENGCRRSFISRHNTGHSETKRCGKMVNIDYSSYHPRILCYLTDFHIPLDIDIYRYLGEIYFGRKNLSPVDLEEAKTITFRQLYGNLEPKYSHIKFLIHAKEFVSEYWKKFNANGYVETPIFKRKITHHHLIDPNPAKLLNYLLQAMEGEIAIPIIGRLNRYLQDKKTKPILYTYDSILFDFFLEDGPNTLKQIIEIMRLDGKFPVKIYAGDNYDDVRQIKFS